MMMDTFDEYIETIKSEQAKEIMVNLLKHIKTTYPNLKEKIGWNQPMFTDHGTFIIGFSLAKNHLAIAPEAKAVQHFEARAKKQGFQTSKQLIKIRFDQAVDYALIDQIIEYNINDKKTVQHFWRQDD